MTMLAIQRLTEGFGMVGVFGVFLIEIKKTGHQRQVAFGLRQLGEGIQAGDGRPLIFIDRAFYRAAARNYQKRASRNEQ